MFFGHCIVVLVVDGLPVIGRMVVSYVRMVKSKNRSHNVPPDDDASIDVPTGVPVNFQSYFKSNQTPYCDLNNKILVKAQQFPRNLSIFNIQSLALEPNH